MSTIHRLYIDADLGEGKDVALTRDRHHYAMNVLRLKPGDPLRLFNARDGEWLAYLASVSKKSVIVRCERRLADATPPPDLNFIFAPLKHARLDYLVQKATELGVRRICPVITQRTIVERVNLDRMRANAIEAAEQCNLVFVPEICGPQKLDRLLANWDDSRALIYSDEAAPVADPLTALKSLRLPAAVLIGPEGGFTEDERLQLRRLPFVTAISLGPRVMRADTAAISTLSLVQAINGDWR
jgi:16S rRNA (uracil1498-N3)-methyltransferase